MKRSIIFAGIIFLLQVSVLGQTVGDFRSKASGVWNSASTWEKCTSVSPETWVEDGYPTNYISRTVTIRSGNTVSANTNILGTTGAKLVIDNGGTLTTTYGITGNVSTRFPYLEINGALTTSGVVTTGTFILGTTGVFTTSYYAVNGWWASSLSPTSLTLDGTVHFNRNGDQPIAAPIADQVYTNIIVSGTGTKYPKNSLVITGTLTINNGATVDLNTKYLTFYDGGIVNDGTFRDTYTIDGAALNFYGSACSISGSGTFPTEFYNINVGEISISPCDASLDISNTLSILFMSVEGSVTLSPSSSVSVYYADFWTDYNYCFKIQSDATGTGSLLIGEGGMNNYSMYGYDLQMQRYMTGNTWHNVSCPVWDQNIYSFITNGSNGIPTKGSAPVTYGSEYYDEAAGGWTYYTSDNLPSSSSDVFTPGSGFLLRRSSTGVVTFTGPMNFFSVDYPIDSTHNAWNSAGNPFTTAIALNSSTGMTNFLTENSANLSPSFAAVYLWNGTSYTIINNTDGATYMQPGQGFLVKAPLAGSILNFNYDMQVHQNSTAFYKKSATESWYKTTLLMSTESDTARTRLLFRDDMSYGLDVTYDAGAFGGNAKFKLYSQLLADNGINFAVQCLPSGESEAMIIPIGLDVTEGGEVNFSADIENLPSGYSMILEDRQLEELVDLSAPGTVYTATIDTLTAGYGRFYVHTMAAKPESNLQEEQLNKLNIYTYNREIFIKGHVENVAFAYLYDITGKLVTTFRLEPGYENRFTVPEKLESGIYILKLGGTGVLKTSKLFIN